MTMLQRIEKLENKVKEQRNSDMDAIRDGIEIIEEKLGANPDWDVIEMSGRTFRLRIWK